MRRSRRERYRLFIDPFNRHIWGEGLWGVFKIADFRVAFLEAFEKRGLAGGVFSSVSEFRECE